ncbi:helix-turn-helix domain-containing protein [Pseudaminobacter soli (ex Li et al. 2025)]|uniref:helix-turn-helix domain-containing protein n=1 Tax=Pseudaminobacter soli (ex Li et al. 2025) TaxID=1295366 RepID=UPI0031450FDD
MSAVAEYLNFRHAAAALGVSQSSVSARIKALESELGILLFERHARGPTGAGPAFCRGCSRRHWQARTCRDDGWREAVRGGFAPASMS